MSKRIQTRGISFFSAGDKLIGDLYLPEGAVPAGGWPLILCLHGYGGLRKTTIPETARRYAEEGFAALFFDYRGFGDSEGDRGRLDPRLQVEDSRNAISFAMTLADIDSSRIGVHGSSFGGAVATSLTAKDTRVRCTVCSMGIGHGGRWLKSLRRNYEWLEFLADIEKDRLEKVITGVSRRVSPYYVMVSDPVSAARQKLLNEKMPERVFQMPLECAEAIIEFVPEDEIAQAPPRPGLIVSIVGDQLVPDLEADSLHEKWPGPKSRKIIPGCKHHDLFTVALEQVLSATLPFFREHLTK